MCWAAWCNDFWRISALMRWCNDFALALINLIHAIQSCCLELQQWLSLYLPRRLSVRRVLAGKNLLKV